MLPEASPRCRMQICFILGLSVLVTAVMLLAIAPFSQPLWYHDFADQRTVWRIPHALNLVSNVPFVIVGVLGLIFVMRLPKDDPDRLTEPGARRAYAIFFALIALTGLGSAYYHAHPNNDRLLWDRLPLAMAFMAFFAIIIGERISRRAGNLLFWPFILLGAASVVYWHQTELYEAGDLRVYLLVQFYPLLAIPLILLLFPPRYTLTADLWAALACYVVAKGLEILDKQVYAQVGIVSGHTLKHLVAAITPLFVLHMILCRRPVSHHPHVDAQG